MLNEEQVNQIKNKQAVLLDVRSDEEVAAGTSPDALHWELMKLEHGQMPDIDKNQPVYCYCRSGGRAGRAKNILQANGFADAQNIGGYDSLPPDLK